MSVLSFFRRSSRSYSNRVTGPRRTRGVRREPQPRRPVFLEPLEDRRMLGLGDLLQTINDPNTLPQWGSQFGSAVAADGNLAVVGTPWADVAGWEDNVGRAYVFNSATGALVATLDNPTPNNPVLGKADQFGVSVALSGDTVVVGAQFEDPGGVEDAGAAYIFDATTGNLLRTLDSPTPARDGCFGESVALSGSTVVVGSRLIDTGANNAGAAYIFDAASGNLRWTLNNPTPTDDEEFGASVAVSGSIAVVGAPYDLIGASRPGSAYIFDAATGNLLRTLNSPAPEGGQLFGASVAISGNTVVVGRGVPWIQAAYVFDAATGNLLSSLEASSGQPVAVSGNTVVVGAPGDDTGATDAGAARVFDAATGSLLWKLNNPAPRAYDRLGYSVAVSGSAVVVGAPAYRPNWGTTGAGSAYVFDAATGTLRWTLGNPTPSTYDVFGEAVAVSGSTVVGGARAVPAGAFDAGAAYLLDAATGSLLHTWNNPTPQVFEEFGNSVALSGSKVVVGASGDKTLADYSGAAYIYDAATGNLLRTLNNPTPAGYEFFGASVALSGSTVVVGAYLDLIGASHPGSAYIFDAATGSLRGTLNNPTPADNDQFGASVAVSGSTLVLGAPRDDTGATDAGSAYIYDAATGDLLWTLNNPTPAASDGFGSSLALSGTTLVVGAPGDDTAATDAGSAYIYDAATGNLLRTLSNPTPAEGDIFGCSVAVSGSTVLVGARLDDNGATDAGAAYVYDAETGSLLWTLNNPTPGAEDYFGWSVAVSGNTLVVGAPRENGISLHRGAVYIFDGDRTGSSAPTGVDLVPASDRGVSNSDNLTNLDNSVLGKRLQFEVSGTIAASTVTICAEGTAIGTAVAAGTTTTVTTDGTHDLADGARSITARQTEPGKSESGDSPALSITIDTALPAADVVDVSPDPRTTAVDKITIGFGEVMAGFDLADLSLTCNGGSNLLTGSQTLASSDNITWELGNLSGLTGKAGSYMLRLTAAGSGITDLAGNALAADASDAWTTNSTVAGRRVFYNNSKFDGHAGFLNGDPAANAFDDAAIDTAKEALLPGGGTAAFKNYSSFSRGINGLMIDVAGLPSATLAATDFAFKYGNDSTPVDWLAAAGPAAIAVRAGAGTGGSDRVTLVWPDNAIPNGNWLQVAVLANANTGLAAGDVFYFGSAIGETGNSQGPTPPADAKVNSSDVTLMRNNYTGFGTVGIKSVYDINRDGKVNSSDVTITRNYYSGFTPLVLITPPAAAPGPLGGAPLVAAQLLAARGSALVLAAESRAPSSGTPAAMSLATSAGAAHDAVFSRNPDRWDRRLYADLAWSWELTRPRPKHKPSDSGFSSQDVRQWMLADYGR